MEADKKATKQELLKFLVTGILAVATDFSSYWLLSDLIPIDMAKGISFVLGSIVAFFLNKLWTFEHDSPMASAAFQFACLYSLTFLSNVAVNHLSLVYVADIRLLGFLLATTTSTILNFIGMKHWVFFHSNYQKDS